MASVRYKIWIILLLIVIAGIVVYSLNRPALRYGTQPESEMKKPSLLGPLMETEAVDQSVLERIEEFSNDSGSLARLGDKHFRNREYDQAIALYSKVLQLDPQDVDTYNDLGLSLHYSGKPDEAIEQLRKGTEIDPSFQRVWLSLGFVLISAGRAEEAADVLKKTVEIAPDSDMGAEAKKFLGLLKSSAR